MAAPNHRVLKALNINSDSRNFHSKETIQVLPKATMQKSLAFILCISPVIAQFAPSPEGLTVIHSQSNSNNTISYKEVSEVFAVDNPRS